MTTIVDGTNGISYPVTAGGTSATQASSSKILQVVYSSTQSGTSTTSQALVNTNLTGTITPSSTSSRILIFVQGNINVSGAGGVGIAIARGGSTIFNPSTVDTTNKYIAFLQNTSTTYWYGGLQYIDSPATTSSTTYTFQIASFSGSSVQLGVNGSQSQAINTMILMEIAG